MISRFWSKGGLTSQPSGVTFIFEGAEIPGLCDNLVGSYQEAPLPRVVDLLMDKTIGKEEFEVKKKKLKDRQYEIDELIRSYDEADDAFNETLLNLVELAARAISYFKGSDITRKRELLTFIFQNLTLREKTRIHNAFPLQRVRKGIKN